MADAEGKICKSEYWGDLKQVEIKKEKTKKLLENKTHRINNKNMQKEESKENNIDKNYVNTMDYITDNNNYVIFAQNKYHIGLCYYIGFYSKDMGFHFLNNIDGVEVGLHPYDESMSNM